MPPARTTRLETPTAPTVREPTASGFPTGESRRRPARPLLRRMQKQLLYAPVQNLSHVQLILRRTRDLVNPAELFHLPPDLAEHADHLAVQRHLIYAPWKRIRRVDVLRRTGRDADGPR